MSRRKLLIVGAFGTGNLGDDAILAGLLKRFASDESLRENRVVVFSRNPDETRLVYSVNARRRNLIDILLCDDVLIGGGELFQDRKNMAAKYSILGLLAKIFHKRVVFHAVGVSPMSGKIGKFLTRVSLSLANEVSVRDAPSKERLRHLGIHRQIIVVQDPALALDVLPYESTSLPLLPRGVEIGKYQGKVLLGLVSQCLENKVLNREMHVFLLTFVQKVLAKYKETQVIYIPFWPSRDLACGEWLCKKLETERFEVLRQKCTPQEMIGLLRHLDLLVSTRLHPLILASRVNLFAIGINMFEKIEAFCTEHEFPCVEIDDNEELFRLAADAIDRKLKKMKPSNTSPSKTRFSGSL